MKEIILQAKSLLTWATEIQAIAQIGLAYCNNHYDKERYEQLMNIAAQMFSSGLEESQALTAHFLAEQGYASPKTDVRAFIYQDKKVLLVQEAQDGKWALPGGWADVNFSASESVIKEVLEETGFQAQVVKLLALWDTAKHDHPPHWPYIYKCIFHCEITGGHFVANPEILAIGFFAPEELPPLSDCRITAKQIHTLVNLIENKVISTAFD